MESMLEHTHTRAHTRVGVLVNRTVLMMVVTKRTMFLMLMPMLKLANVVEE